MYLFHLFTVRVCLYWYAVLMVVLIFCRNLSQALRWCTVTVHIGCCHTHMSCSELHMSCSELHICVYLTTPYVEKFAQKTELLVAFECTWGWCNDLSVHVTWRKFLGRMGSLQLLSTLILVEVVICWCWPHLFWFNGLYSMADQTCHGRIGYHWLYMAIYHLCPVELVLWLLVALVIVE